MKETSPISQSNPIFSEEDKKMEELKKSVEVLDKITLLLMEPEINSEDPVGLYFVFARAKALRMIKEFEIKPREVSL